MRFSILGPLTVIDGGQDVPITAGRDRVVLAMLLLHEGRTVSANDLIDAVWERSPPVTARGQLQTCVSRLRRLLPSVLIQTHPEGYGVKLGAHELDAHDFARLAAEAHSAAEPDTSRRLFRQALDLSRGDALAGTDSRSVRQAAAVLDEQYAAVVEDWVDLELEQGRGRDLLAHLTGLVERFPLRERLRAQMILALYRVGRQADALAEYRRAADLLRDELGIEPGPHLREIQRYVLKGEAGSHEPVRTTAGGVRALPRTVGDFTGRVESVARLLKTIENSRHAGPVLVLIDGMAGSGKTTLALHVADVVADHYPDAHLFIDLHGHSARQPVDPGEALLTLLRQLGVAAGLIPAERTERVALWRNELATRRVLVVFDNAASSAQLADLLPTSAASLALVTARRRLIGLDGALPESLSVLAEDEAIALLARIAGDRVRADPLGAAEVVRRCGLLPLAIRLAGARLAHRPRWAVADLLRRLGTAALPELAAEERTVADAFAVSYRQLATPAHRAFRLLGSYPGRWFDAPAVAALTDQTLDAAEELLDDLVDVHLIEEPEAGVFRLHDLLREYAAALAADAPADESRAAIAAVLDFQLHALAATNSTAHRAQVEQDLRLAEPRRPDLVGAVADPAARLERERPSLGAFQEAGIAIGRPEYAWLLPRAAWRLLWSRGYYDDIAVLHTRAVRVAEENGDRHAVGMSANYLSSAYFRQARYDQARSLLEISIRIWRELGDEGALAVSLSNLSIVHEANGRYLEAVEVSAAALRLTSPPSAPYPSMRSSATAPLTYLGRYAEALRGQRLRLLQAIEIRDGVAVANSLLDIVVNRRRAGDIGSSAAHRRLTAAISQFRAHGYPFGEAQARDELADLLRAEGRYSDAVDQHRAALDLIVRLGDRRFELSFTIGLARTLLSVGDVAQARERYEYAMGLAQAIPQSYEIGRAHAGLGDCLCDTDPEAARHHWRSALSLFTMLAVPERFEVEQRLAGA